MTFRIGPDTVIEFKGLVDTEPARGPPIKIAPGIGRCFVKLHEVVTGKLEEDIAATIASIDGNTEAKISRGSDAAEAFRTSANGVLLVAKPTLQLASVQLPIHGGHFFSRLTVDVEGSGADRYIDLADGILDDGCTVTSIGSFRNLPDKCDVQHLTFASTVLADGSRMPSVYCRAVRGSIARLDWRPLGQISFPCTPDFVRAVRDALGAAGRGDLLLQLIDVALLCGGRLPVTDGPILIGSNLRAAYKEVKENGVLTISD